MEDENEPFPPFGGKSERNPGGRSVHTSVDHCGYWQGKKSRAASGTVNGTSQPQKGTSKPKKIKGFGPCSDIISSISCPDP